MNFFSKIRSPQEVRARFEPKCEPVESGCIEWRAYCGAEGYGRISVEGEMRLAHRVAYILAHGDIEDDTLELDHLCRNRRCVNVAHLELVTKRENQLRSPVSIISKAVASTRCPQGHSDYVRRPSDGARICRTCVNARSRAAYWRRRKQLSA